MMNGYLDLIPISAKVHRRRNRMTILCIIIAVFLVTTVFSMADMAIRMERRRAIYSYGNWHILIREVEEDTARQIGEREDVDAFSYYAAINEKINEEYYINGRKAAVCGIENSMADILPGFSEKDFPLNDQEVLLTANAESVMGIKKGDSITVSMPSGDYQYTVAGFNEDTASALKYDAVVVFMNREALKRICETEHTAKENPEYYLRFKGHRNYRKAIENIKQEYGLKDGQVGENTSLLMTSGFSSNSYITGLYLVAGVLFVLILTAGVFMIAGSINSNVAERMQFFGMLRCIGASKRQIIRFVRAESLNWCKRAIPTGVVSGIAVTWALCAVLRYIVSSEFLMMPVFGVSPAGILCGIIVGLLTVLIAARAPAKRAAAVSPVMAAAGYAENRKAVRRGVKMYFLKVESALGLYHAAAAKKNLILMTGSFALSIVLFLGFSALITYVHHALNQMRPYTPDFSVMSSDRSCCVDRDLAETFRMQPGVEKVYGRMYKNVSADCGGKSGSIDLISYEDYQFDWAEEALSEGDMSKVTEDSDYVLIVYDRSNVLKTGDRIRLKDGAANELEVAGILEDSPFDSLGTPIAVCSEETFRRLTGETDYAVIDIQFTKKATEEEVNRVRLLAGENYSLSDRRESNRDVTGIYWGFSLFVYGFIVVIAMITVLNIVNSISMSVSAKIRQYGMMRAVGMEAGQLTKMILTETVTYVILGFAAGCAMGLPLHKGIFSKMITDYWGTPYQVPYTALFTVALLMVLSSAAAVYAPAKRIRNMTVTDVIGEL